MKIPPTIVFVLALTSAACGARRGDTGTPVAAPAAGKAPEPARAEAPRAAPPVVRAESKKPVDPPASRQPGGFVPSAADQVLVSRLLVVIDQVTLVMERQQNACDRMAADLDLILQRNQDLMLLGKQMKGDPAREKWMQEQLMPRLEAALPRMMTGFQKCQNDASMQALVQKLAS